MVVIYWFDCVGGFVFGEFDGVVVGEEVIFVFVEVGVGELGWVLEVGFWGIEVKEFVVELVGCVDVFVWCSVLVCV